MLNYPGEIDFIQKYRYIYYYRQFFEWKFYF